MAPLPLGPDELLTTTRAVRKRLDLSRPVPMELIRECLDIATQAPTGSNKQGWHWIVVTDEAKRKAIGEIYRGEFERYRAAGGVSASLHQDDPERAAVQARVGSSADYLAQHMGEVPVHLIAAIEASRLPAANQASLWGSILPAVWSYMLAARARRLGTVWTTLHLHRERDVADLLGLPENIHQGALIPTAYYTGETFKPAPRVPLDDIVHVDGW